MDSTPHPIVLFDGACNFCGFWVGFLIRRDAGKTFRFAALQSRTGMEVLASLGGPAPDSLLFVERDGRVFVESTAVLRIALRMGGLWRLGGLFLLVPRPLRDWAYRFIARNRYRWFGRKNACLLPTPDILDRFLP
jgi:predicted DCC family thiol-disulfide oxidoreductase YuxK